MMMAVLGNHSGTPNLSNSLDESSSRGRLKHWKCLARGEVPGQISEKVHLIIPDKSVPEDSAFEDRELHQLQKERRYEPETPSLHTYSAEAVV